MIIQQNTVESILMVADYAQTGMLFPGYGTPTAYKISVNGAPFVAGVGVYGGNYISGNGPTSVQITLDVTETAVLGELTVILLDGGGNVMGVRHIQIVPWNPHDVAGLGLTRLDANVSAVANEVLDQADAIDTSLTPRQALRLITAALAGRIAISGFTVTIQDTTHTKNRIVATVDGTGQRTTLAYDLT
jgi:hypothetical protein